MRHIAVSQPLMPGQNARKAPASAGAGWQSAAAATGAAVFVGVLSIYLLLRPPLFDYDGYLNRLEGLGPARGANINPHHLMWYPIQMAIAAATSAWGSPPGAFQWVGIIINSLALIYPVREVEGIERFRIAQKALDCFHVQVVRTSQFQSDAEARIRSGWVRLLRTPLQVTFEYVTELPMERSGKFRHFVSEIPAAHSGEQMRDSQAAMGISSRN